MFLVSIALRFVLFLFLSYLTLFLFSTLVYVFYVAPFSDINVSVHQNR